MNIEQQYIDLYQQAYESICNHSSEALNVQRNDFFERFVKKGFPTRHTPTYRNIDLTSALSVDYGLNINRLQISVNPYQVFHCDVPGIQSYLYFVINDVFFQDNASQNKPLPKGVIICGLKEATEKYPQLVAQYLNKQAAKTQDPLTAFNGMFAQDGFFMYVPDGVVLEKTVQLVNIMRSDVNMMANSHNLIIIGKKAQAKLLVCDHTMDKVHFCSNRTTEVFLGENAIYEHYKVESTSENMCNICTLLIDQQAHSNALTNVITLHNGITRNNILIEQNGTDCETLLCGLLIGGGKQCADNFTHIRHNQPQGRSNELFKYVLDDCSRGIFTGELKVAPHAQKTAAYQTNRNILLSPTAKVRTQPQLEIYADDVKCSHGATTGQIDETALFYMRQRGISEKEAKLLLMYAFVHDVIENIRVDNLRERVKLLVEKRLRGETSKCSNCLICK